MEHYTQIFSTPNAKRILPGGAFTFHFDYTPEPASSYQLFFTGEVDNFYFWKHEHCCNSIYKRIDDSLIPGEMGAFGLRFTGADYPMVCCKKVNFPPCLVSVFPRPIGDEWKVGFFAKADNLRLKSGGYLRLTIEIRKKREGMLAGQTNFPPDEQFTIELDEGTYDLKEFSLPMELNSSEIGNIFLVFEGEDFEGDVIFEAPYLKNVGNDYNVLAPFAPDTVAYGHVFNWYGVNLSHTEWPKMRILLNDTEIFSGEFFERCHRYSEKEFVFSPTALKSGDNALTFQLCSDWHDPLPYCLKEVGIVHSPAHTFDLISFPQSAVQGEDFSILIDAKEALDLTVTGEVSVHSDLHIPEKGLYGITLSCEKLCTNLDVTFSDGRHTETFTIDRVISRKEDGVLTGTGDLIYIDQTPFDFENYIKWYCSNRIGRLITIRPTYRWSGTRKYNSALWADFVRIMDSMGMKYAHMVDGREPNGYCCNPSIGELSSGKGFLGRQLHERDGAYNYWGSHETDLDFWNLNKLKDTELFFDLLFRMTRLDPDHFGGVFYDVDLFNDGKRYWLCQDHSLPADAKVRAEAVMRSFSLIREKTKASRHTGPSIMFKYFLMAGYSWVGAETMDSPTEFLMAALRGAAESFGVKTIGVHHALQWSSHPHEDPLRYRRYRLALYISWMQGAHENNTEEGLWHMEEYYEAHHRHSIAAREHLKVHQDFNRYISTHSRQGRLRADVGILHGRYDGAACFGTGSPWGAKKSDFRADFDTEKSWHIPRLVFYPNATRGWAATRHAGQPGPIGLVSGNPLGNFNIIPVEKPWRYYNVLAFFGYHAAQKEDLDRIYNAVQDGSVLLATLAHLSPTTLRADVESYNHSFESHILFDALGFEKSPTLTADSINGLPVKVGMLDSADKIWAYTDNGLPLVIEKQIGKGRVLLFNVLLYPAAEAIRELYTETFRKLSENAYAASFIQPIVDTTVQATQYDLPDGSSEIYYMAVDWWNEEDTLRHAALRIGDAHYDIELPFGVMKKVKVQNQTAIVCDTESGDVLSLSDSEVLLQGEGKEHFTVLADNQSYRLDMDFSKYPQKSISLQNL